MRDARDYGAKQAGVFRVICLGDSFVFGLAGREEDRFGNQLEELLQASGGVGGKRVEVLSLGLGSWTALGESQYLTSRLSAYSPDLVLALMTTNDISEASGVLGIGQATQAFSPESRAYGSGGFFGSPQQRLGIQGKTALTWGLGAESVKRWRKTMSGWRRLADCLNEIGAGFVLGVLNENPLFVELCHHWAGEVGLVCPQAAIDFADQRLPHDGHPNRQGHALIARRFLAVCLAAHLLPDEQGALQREVGELASTPWQGKPRADLPQLQRMQAAWVRDTLSESLVFDQLAGKEWLCFLGGAFPETSAQGAEVATLPCSIEAAPRCGFLLARKAGANELELVMEVRPRVELFPLSLELWIDGERATRAEIASPGEIRLRAPLKASDSSVVEVILFADRWYCQIEDPTMRCCTLHTVTQLP